MFPATTQTFTKDTALSEQGKGAAWRVWINARHGRGTAWARHAMCESAFIRHEVSCLEPGRACPFRCHLCLINFLDHSLCNCIAIQHTSMKATVSQSPFNTSSLPLFSLSSSDNIFVITVVWPPPSLRLLIFSLSGFALSYATDTRIFMILYGFCFLPA